MRELTMSRKRLQKILVCQSSYFNSNEIKVDTLTLISNKKSKGGYVLLPGFKHRISYSDMYRNATNHVSQNSLKSESRCNSICMRFFKKMANQCYNFDFLHK